VGAFSRVSWFGGWVTGSGTVVAVVGFVLKAAVVLGVGCFLSSLVFVRFKQDK